MATVTVRSLYLRNKILDIVLRGSTWVPIPNIYSALFITAPTDLTAGIEVSGGGYTRVPIVFTVPAVGETHNFGLISFPIATGSWGLITTIGMFDSLTGGNLLYYGPTKTQFTINIGDLYEINMADLVIREI